MTSYEFYQDNVNISPWSNKPILASLRTLNHLLSSLTYDFPKNSLVFIFMLKLHKQVVRVDAITCESQFTP